MPYVCGSEIAIWLEMILNPVSRIFVGRKKNLPLKKQSYMRDLLDRCGGV